MRPPPDTQPEPRWKTAADATAVSGGHVPRGTRRRRQSCTRVASSRLKRQMYDAAEPREEISIEHNQAHCAADTGARATFVCSGPAQCESRIAAVIDAIGSL